MPTAPYNLLNGHRVPGVTTIIGNNLGWNKDALKHWAWKQGKEGRDYRDVTKAACDAGTIAHYLIECFLKKIQPDIEQYKNVPEALEQAKFSFEQNFIPWSEMTRFEVVALEQHLVSEFLEFGATPDLIAKVRGNLAIVDWKTSGGLYPEMIIQVSAYEHAWNETHPEQKIQDGAYMLRIDRETASFHFHHWTDLSKPWQVFLNLLEIHNLKYGIKRMT
jgi:hypothetical protein